MRIAAGIMMILGGVAIWFWAHTAYWSLIVPGIWNSEVPFYLSPFLFTMGIVYAGVVVFTGGILSLGRTAWGFCLASGLLIAPAMLPALFVILRRSEWKN